mmetsp:Transcript_19036/g.44628  ORF Transcript_19036/g.44628 Transcript_19036/m.44628 type:complete len:342 (+) Transcript_19036:53-1078(+)
MTVDRSQQNSTASLVVCVAGIYGSYLGYGLLQEKITTHSYGASQEQFVYILFMLWLQCLFGAGLAGSAILWTWKQQPASGFQCWALRSQDGRVSALHYALVGLCFVSAMTFSTVALHFVNYPTQAIAKSCKMIPVMAVGVLWRRRQYDFREYMRVALVTLGIIIFSLFQQDRSAETQANSIMGLSLLIVSLVIDGFVGPSQEWVREKHGSSVHQLMFYSNSWAVLFVGASLLVTGEAEPSLAFVKRHPEVLKDLCYFATLSAVGQNFVFYLVRNFSALTLVTVTTTRKFFTVLTSITFGAGGKGHTLTGMQWLGVFAVFFGLSWDYLSTVRKNKASANKQH